MYKTIDKWEPDYLLSDPNGAQKIAIPCTPGKGVVQRGQIMKRAENGMYDPAAAADIVATNNLVVINETVDTDEDATVAATAAAYRAGRMFESRLRLAENGTLTAAHKLILRQQGILTDPMMDEAAEFNNSTATE